MTKNVTFLKTMLSKPLNVVFLHKILKIKNIIIMKKLVITVALLIGATSFAQKTEAELKAEKAKLEGEIKSLKAKVSGLDGQLAKYNKGWKFGLMGTAGANFSGYTNWYTNSLKNSQTGNIGIVLNGFANLDADKYFWKNSATLNLGWTKIVNYDLEKEMSVSEFDKLKKYQNTSDALNINSLFGYKITPKLAASALAEYRTTVIKNFNNPGYLDFGVGFTWTPMPEFLMVVHPANYNYVFSDTGSTYESSLGCKVMAEYKKDFGLLKYRSNVTAFVSYTDLKNLSNWTWVNSLGFNLWKGFGVGLEGGLRQNKQENYNATGGADKWGELKYSDNLLQSYWLVGLSYSM